MKIKSISWDEAKVGEEVKFLRVVDKDMVDSFILISGDHNPLHNDEGFSKRTIFKKPIVPGMLLASLFSALVGIYMPGKDGLYLFQSLNFKRPVFIGEEVVVFGKVMKKMESLGLLYVKTLIYRGDQIVVEGEATIKHLNYEK